MNVEILVTIRKPEHFEASTLCFDTLRIGFPTADIHVTINPVDVLELPLTGLKSEFYDHLRNKIARVNPASCGIRRQPVHHANWIRERVYDDAERKPSPLIILDPDTIFWKSCEGWDFKALVTGHYIPRIWNDFAKCISVPRLHTSFLWFTNPPALRDLLAQIYPLAHQPGGDYCPCDPFMPAVRFVDGTPYFWDSCANLYNMLRYFTNRRWAAAVRWFSPEQFECYDHINSASFYDVMLDRLEAKELFAYVHRFLVREPEKLRNLWPMVNAYYEAKRLEACRKEQERAELRT